MKQPPTSLRIPVRTLYSIAELARATRMGRGRLRRMLDERGVELFVVNGRPCVPLSEIVAKLKPLWDSVQASEDLGGEGDDGDADEDCFE
ncbi:MAG TPA: hypothetical protein VIY73_01240 [Polyangiaceae bacterium]